MATEIAQLFSHQRIGDRKTAVLLALYFPFGLIVAVLRLFIGLHVFVISCILPRQVLFCRVLLRILYAVLGCIVFPSNLQRVNPNTRVIVANHVSVLDHVMIGLIFPSVVPNVWSLPPFLNWALGYTDMGAVQGRQVFLDEVRKHCSHNARPVIAFPEGAMTNGRTGLLKFSTWAFSLERDVQPMVLTIQRPLVNMRAEVLGSSLWQDLLWFFFVPFTVFRIKVLPVEKRSDFENADDFSRGVQKVMAADMGVSPTHYTSADKAEYVKNLDAQATTRVSIERPHQSQSSQPQGETPPAHISSSDPALDRMVKQVLEVLPHIPQHVIRKELETTNSVDTTIFNILENNTVLPIPAEDSPGSSTSSPGATGAATPPHNTFCMTSGGSTLSTPSPACTKFAADRFGGSSTERQKSLQDRKAALLANARRRFTEQASAQ